MYCARCGSKITAGARFCASCGRPVGNLAHSEVNGGFPQRENGNNVPAQNLEMPGPKRKSRALVVLVVVAVALAVFVIRLVLYVPVRESSRDVRDSQPEPIDEWSHATELSEVGLGSISACDGDSVWYVSPDAASIRLATSVGADEELYACASAGEADSGASVANIAMHDKHIYFVETDGEGSEQCTFRRCGLDGSNLELVNSWTTSGNGTNYAQVVGDRYYYMRNDCIYSCSFESPDERVECEVDGEIEGWIVGGDGKRAYVWSGSDEGSKVAVCDLSSGESHYIYQTDGIIHTLVPANGRLYLREKSAFVEQDEEGIRGDQKDASEYVGMPFQKILSVDEGGSDRICYFACPFSVDDTPLGPFVGRDGVITYMERLLGANTLLYRVQPDGTREVEAKEIQSEDVEAAIGVTSDFSQRGIRVLQFSVVGDKIFFVPQTYRNDSPPSLCFMELDGSDVTVVGMTSYEVEPTENNDLMGLARASSLEFEDDIAIKAAGLSAKANSETSFGIIAELQEIGFERCKPNRYSDTNDDEDSFAVTIGMRESTVNDEEVTYVAVVTRGTTTTNEKVSDIAHGKLMETKHSGTGIGIWSNIANYEALVKDDLEAYAKKNGLDKTSRRLVFLVCGHSLGGACASTLGARLTHGLSDSDCWWCGKTKQEDIHVYTFGGIKVIASDEDISDGYENIHNVYNEYDSFGPKGNWSDMKVSLPGAKFGHTEMFHYMVREKGWAIWDRTTYCHDIDLYRMAVLDHRDNGAREYGLTTCSDANKDDDDEAQIAEPQQEDGRLEGTYRDTSTGQEFTFGSDGSVEMNAFGITGTGTYEIEGGNITIRYRLGVLGRPIGDEYVWTQPFSRDGDDIFISNTRFVRV